MLARDETVMAVKERMHTLSPSDICALFLVSADKKKQENEAAGPDWDEAAKRIQSLLGRFFRQTDIVGRIGENRYAAFLAGTLIPIDATALLLDILKVVIVPIVIGISLRAIASKAVDSIAGVFLRKRYGAGVCLSGGRLCVRNGEKGGAA